ncbi:Na+/H+ antiporter subunit E [Crassaminicella profunda]|uniref:Na+/H+ antiporter subunit E n=1 Tax=Crassaminicella profunda TaxID=1286698 RepID=UPI001CA652A6|nr:Na+/H+ antiporter subunit E [Crassaminicella profunda]QZY55283.1 Na+/H+ antiporter subunit E [Crassaminicella profunda]
MNRGIRLFFFMVFWMVLAETINMERLWIGGVISLGVYALNKDLIISNGGKCFQVVKKISCFVTYLFILMKEIVIANFQVAKIVLSPKMNISPEIVKFHSKLKSDFYRTILANSITLTPGTLTVFMEGDELIVHCLKKEYIEDVLNSKFEKILLKIEE